MSTVPVSLGGRSYPIIIEPGLLARAAEFITSDRVPSYVMILTHPRLAPLYAEPLMHGLSARGVPASVVTIPPGERYKNLSTVRHLYNRMLAAGLDRKSLLVTLGGGVLGDLGGFAAATYLRGIPFVQMPTSLLAQVDASIGGKTGVDLPGGKNLVGAFYQPRAVLIDTCTLDTLPTRELRTGLAEVIKYGIICDEAFFQRVRGQLPALLRRDSDALTEAIVRSCQIKADVVRQDETEQGLRAILNFGHTVGHALEAVTGYRRYRHGEAISIGMVSAALIGEEVGETPPSVTEEIQEVLTLAGLPTVFPPDVSIEEIWQAMLRDKKTTAGKVHFVLARRIGEVIVRGDVSMAAVQVALERQRVGEV